MQQKNSVRYAICGAAAGLVNGFFGAGGGMVLVPLLLYLGKLEDKKAFSSAVCIILPLCLVSVAVYALRGTLKTDDALPYLIGGALGGVAAGLSFQKIPARVLHLVLGALIIFGGLRLLLC